MNTLIPTSRRYLPALVLATLSPAAAAADPPLKVDGVEETLPPGSYNTTGNSQAGLLVINGGRATGSGIDITTTGSNSYAAEVHGAASHASLATGTLYTAESSAYGLFVHDGGSTSMENVTIGTEGGRAIGAYFKSRDARGQFRGGRIETTGYAAIGILAEDGGAFSLDDVAIRTAGTAAKGLQISDGGAIEARGANILTLGTGSDGLHVGAQSSVTLTESTLATQGHGAHAVHADRGSGLVTIGEQSKLLTSNADAIGLNVQDGSRVVVRQSLIETQGSNAQGVYNLGAAVELQDVDVITHGGGSYGVIGKGGDYPGRSPQIDLRNTRVVTHGALSYGTVASGGGRLELFDTSVTTAGRSAHGLVANAGALRASNTAVSTAGENAYGILVENAGNLKFTGGTVRSAQWAALGLNDPGTILIGGGAILEGGNGAFAHVDPNSSKDFTVVLEDHAHGSGDIRLGRASTTKPQEPPSVDQTRLSLLIRRDASWAGASEIVRNLALETGGTWVVTGDSRVDALRSDRGIVTFAPVTPGTFATLTIAGDYEGNEGLFRMRGRLGDDGSPADRIHVMGSTSGTSFIAIDSLDGTGANTVEGIPLIKVDGRSEGVFELSGRAVAGAHDYFLHKGSLSQPGDGGWYLRSSMPDPTLEPENGNDPGDPADPVVPPPSVLRPETGAYRANQAAALDMFQGGPGAGRDDEPEHARGSAWARFERRHTAFDIGSQVTTTTSTHELTIGSDLLQGGGDVDGHFGIMAAMGQSDTRGTSLISRYSARGRVKGAAAGVYGGLRTAGGTYLRGWTQYAHFNQRVEGQALPSERYGSGALTTSVEAGHRWRRALNRDTDIYLEPQAQLVATRLRGGTHTEANGTRIAPRHASGSTARLGLRAASRWQTPRGHVASPYVAGSWLRRLGRLDATRFDDTPFTSGVPRNAYALKLGLSVVRNDGWRLWGDVETRFGVQRYRRVAGTVGVRKTW